MFFALGWFFWLFNIAFRYTTNAYTRVVGMLLRVSFLVLIVYAAMLGLTYWGFNQLPTGYIPTQDKGYLLVSIQMPDATALERTKEVVNRVDQDPPRGAGGRPHHFHLGPVVRPERLRPQLRPVLRSVEAL